MLSQKAKGIICCASIVLVAFFVFGKAEATNRRVLENQDAMEETVIKHKKINLNGNLFDVYINQDTETITVCGRIEVYNRVDWNEVQEIKRHFQTEDPGNYEFVYKFKFTYNS